MTIGSTFRHSLIAALLISMGACSSVESGDPGADNTTNAGEPGEQAPIAPSPDTNTDDPVNTPDDETVPAATDTEQDDPPTADGQNPLEPPPAPGSVAPDDQQPPSDDEQNPPAENPPAENPPAENPPGENPPGENPPGENPPGENPPGENPPGENPPGENPPGENPPGENPPVENPPTENPPAGNPPGALEPPPPPGGVRPDDMEPDASNKPLIPPVTMGSDLERLIDGLTQQVSITLLDLNQRISEGQELTGDENECLGSYEEGLGQPLTSIDCGDRRLFAGIEERFAIDRAAFYATPECLDSLRVGNSNSCVLQTLSLTIAGNFDNSSSGAAMLLFPGAELAYAVGDTSLRIDSDSQALSGVFSCEINLETAAVSSEGNGPSCDNTIKSMADEIERVLAQ